MKFQALYSHYYVRPQFDSLGRGYMFMYPWNIKVFGSGINIGDYANILASSDNKVRLTVWPGEKGSGKISIGDYCLICPGVRISAADEIVIEDNCMMAGSTFITDADWHGTYDRINTIGRTAPVHIKENVWLGDRSTVCKGVVIGENSIIGAGAVVIKDIPPDVIAAGNPARVVKQLDPEHPVVKRKQWFERFEKFKNEIESLDRKQMSGNTFFHWLRTKIKPGLED